MNLLFLPNPSKKGNTILVGVLEHFLFFHILGIIIPTDFHIFQMGRSTNNQNLFVPQKAPFRKPSIMRFSSQVSALELTSRILASGCTCAKAYAQPSNWKALIILSSASWSHWCSAHGIRTPSSGPDFSELEEDLKRLWSTLGPWKRTEDFETPEPLSRSMFFENCEM